jgi:hypothetical protein
MSGWPPSPIRCAPRAPSTASPPTPSTWSSRASRTAVGSSRHGPRAEKAHDGVRRVTHLRPRKSLLRPRREPPRTHGPTAPLLPASTVPAPTVTAEHSPTRAGAAAHNVDGDTRSPRPPAITSPRATPPSTMWTAACAISAAKIGTRVSERLKSNQNRRRERTGQQAASY